MKWLAVLAGAILILVVVWFLVGPSSSPPASEIKIPPATADRGTLVESAKQLVEFNPTPANVASSVQLLRSLLANLPDSEWPSVAHDVFLGWNRIHGVPGSQESLQTVAGDLLDRLARHLEGKDLEALVRFTKAESVYAARAGEAIDRAAGDAIKSYEGSALARLVGACIRTGEFKRASHLVSLCRFSAEAPEEARAPVARIARILENVHKAPEGRSEAVWVAQEWKKSEATPELRAALAAAGVAVAKSGKEKADYSALKSAMAETRAEEGAAGYWRDVLETFVSSLPRIGRYAESDVLAALSSEYAATFKDAAFESQFWQRLADDNTEKHISEVMWRIDCLIRAARTAPEEARRLELATRFVSELEKVHVPGRARSELQALAPKVESAQGKGKVAELFDDIGKKEEEEKVLALKRQADRKQNDLQSEVSSLRGMLSQMKTSGGAPEVIANLERRIKDLEKKLAE